MVSTAHAQSFWHNLYTFIYCSYSSLNLRLTLHDNVILFISSSTMPGIDPMPQYIFLPLLHLFYIGDGSWLPDSRVHLNICISYKKKNMLYVSMLYVYVCSFISVSPLNLHMDISTYINTYLHMVVKKLLWQCLWTPFFFLAGVHILQFMMATVVDWLQNMLKFIYMPMSFQLGYHVSWCVCFFSFSFSHQS